MSTSKKATAIIQARMQSKRLPGKSMREISGRPLLAHVVDRACAIEGIQAVIVATCPDNEPIIDLCKEMGVGSFVGSESNVLERYYLAAQTAPCDYVVRITGDNPFTDVEYGSLAVKKAVDNCADLSSVSGLPLGTGVEVIKYSALEEAFRKGSTPYHFEHVSPYIKEHPECFSIQRFPVQMYNPFGKLRLTVDTVEDYDLACLLYQALYKGFPFSIRDVIAYLGAHPDLASLNEGIEQRPMTHSEN